MEMAQRIPDLSDAELETLHANAVRLAQSGTLKQKQQAESLLPLLDTALEQRRAVRAEAALARKRGPVKRKSPAGAKEAATD